MPITLENDVTTESRKSGNGHDGNGHGVRDRVSEKAHRVEEDDSTLVLQEIMRLVDASKEGRLNERGKATLFNGTDREIIQGVNEMLDAILLPIGEGNRVLAQISAGKIDELITQNYKGDHEKMKLAVNNVAQVVQGLQKELARLVEASREGQLSDRGKPEQFQGAYAEIVRGVNTMLDAILLPIGEGNRILAQVPFGRHDWALPLCAMPCCPATPPNRRQGRTARAAAATWTLPFAIWPDSLIRGVQAGARCR